MVARGRGVGELDDAPITAILERAGTNADLGAVADDYAAVDRRIVEEAHVVPFGNRENTVLYSDRVDADSCTLWHPVYNLDLTRLCLR